MAAFEQLQSLGFVEQYPDVWVLDLFTIEFVYDTYTVTHAKHKGRGLGASPREACINLWETCLTLREVEKYAVPIPRVPLLVMGSFLDIAVQSLVEMKFQETDLDNTPHAWRRGDILCVLEKDHSGWRTWKEDVPTVVGFSLWPKQALYSLQMAHTREAERALGHAQSLTFLLQQLEKHPSLH